MPRASTKPPSTAAASTAPLRDMEKVPLPGREAEFDSILAFVNARLCQAHGRTLFVFGACGCGKTSTVLRALRAFQTRPLPCDQQVHSRDEKRGSRAERDSDTAGTPRRGAKRARAAGPPADVESESGVPRRGKDMRGEAGHQSPSFTPSCSASPACSSSRPSAGGDGGGAGDSPHSAGHLSTRSSTDGPSILPDAAPATDLLGRCGGSSDVPSISARYPALFSAVTAAAAAGPSPRSTAAKAAAAQGHYVNCADLSPEQLAAAVHDSLKRAYPRPNANVSAFMADILRLPERCRKSRRTTQGDRSGAAEAALAGNHAVAGTTKATSHQKCPLPLQVVVLDEVEYVRPATRALLTELAAMSFHPSSRLALICISNQRDLVHVPLALLEELAFPSYTVQQLKQIGMAIAQEEIEKRFPKPTGAAAAAAAAGVVARTANTARPGARAKDLPPTASTGTTAPVAVTISPSLFEYVARKALLEYSGDVRQVAAMCRRVVYTAFEEWKAKAECACVGDGGDGGSNAAVSEQSLEAVVNAYCDSSRKTNAPTAAVASGSSSFSSSPRTSTSSAPSAAAAAAPQRCAVTLASSLKVMKGAGVEDHLRQHMDTMPEQSLYLLSCLIILTQKHERDRRSAAVAVGAGRTHGGGRGGGGGSHVANSTAMTQREAHGLYMRLMSHLHFPPMHGSGVANTFSFLADIGIITRPQRRGNDDMFSFSGACSMEALEMALMERGERYREEMLAAGLEGGENRFAAVLKDLKTLTGLTL